MRAYTARKRHAVIHIHAVNNWNTWPALVEAWSSERGRRPDGRSPDMIFLSHQLLAQSFIYFESDVGHVLSSAWSHRSDTFACISQKAQARSIESVRSDNRSDRKVTTVFAYSCLWTSCQSSLWIFYCPSAFYYHKFCRLFVRDCSSAMPGLSSTYCYLTRPRLTVNNSATVATCFAYRPTR